MGQHCACGCGHGAAAPSAPYTAEQTVEQVAHRSPVALDTLKRLGINHCCGAHMSLTEAAAAAGVPLEEVLRALNGPVPAPA